MNAIEQAKSALEAANAACTRIVNDYAVVQCGIDFSALQKSVGAALAALTENRPLTKLERFLEMVRVWVERDGGNMDAALAFMYSDSALSAPAQMTDEELHEEALAVWATTTGWNLTRDDFIRLSYFHGCMENGSDGKGPINGSEDRPGDVVYKSPEGHCLTRAMVSYWFSDSNAFIHGYKKGVRAIESRALSSAAGQEPVAWNEKAALTVLGMTGDGPYGQSDVDEAIAFLKAAEIVRQNIVDAAPAKPQEQPVAAQQDEDVKDFVEGYECDTGEGIYQPNEHERFLIEDAIRTFLSYRDMDASHAEYVKAQAPQQEAGQARELPDERYSVRDWIEAAWCAGYYHAGYTHDSAYSQEKSKEFADHALQGLASAPAQPTVPEGFALVPIEPTPEMIKAGQGFHGLEWTYKNMIAAAPVAQKGEK